MTSTWDARAPLAVQLHTLRHVIDDVAVGDQNALELLEAALQSDKLGRALRNPIPNERATAASRSAWQVHALTNKHD
jgi:hypothetical protein